MTTNQYRHPAEGVAQPEKEMGRTGNDQATHTQNTHPNDTAPDRGLYLPLTWAPAKPAKFRGKTKRATKRDAISRKRGEK